MKQIFNPHWDEWFTKKIKGFMVWYGVLFILLVLLSLYVSAPNVPLPLYLLFFSSLLATGVLLFIPLKWFGYLVPLSIPCYLLFIHVFLLYTGGAESPYYFMYLMPLILASLLFHYAGAIITLLLILASHLVLESTPVIPYLSSEHFLTRDIPISTMAFLAAIMLSVIVSMMEKGRETMRHLFGQVEKAKKDWEASFDAVQDTIFILDKEQTIMRVNRAAAERFKKAPQELIGEKCYKLCHGLDNPIENCPHVKAMETGKPQTIEIEEPYLGGIFEITTYPLFDDNPLSPFVKGELKGVIPPLLRGTKGNVVGSVHYMKDITAHKKMDAALKREFEITKTLHNTDTAILSTMDKQEVLQLCITNFRALVDADYISIAAFDSEKNEFKLEASSFFNLFSADKRIIPFDSTILKWAVSSRISRYCPDIKDEDLLRGDRWFKHKGIKSLLIAPLIAKGRPLGTFNIGSLKKERFHQGDIELAEKYALQIAIALDNANLYEGMHNLFMDTVASLSSVIDTKSPWTQNHSAGAANHALAIAKELGLDESFIKELRIAVLLHDIGKVGIDEAILNKSTYLSDEEFKLVKEHPLKGAAILEPIKELRGVVQIIRNHHEWWNGTGYPDRLSGNMIPLGARILCVADAFDAMIANRPYRRGFTVQEAKQELIRFAGTQCDPQVVDAFLKVIEKERQTEGA
ncbi:MAG: HD domain-containing protein, partial [Deltaproteobacteria bacterium]|nr:HD domain-containing protein [Deltaproteobacteria bacterium]